MPPPAESLTKSAPPEPEILPERVSEVPLLSTMSVPERVMALPTLRLVALAAWRVPLPRKVSVFAPRAYALLTVRSAPEREIPVAIELLLRKATEPLVMARTPLMFRLLLTVREPAPPIESEVAVRVSPPRETSVLRPLITVTSPAVTPPLTTFTSAVLVKLAELPLEKMAGSPLV